MDNVLILDSETLSKLGEFGDVKAAEDFLKSDAPDGTYDIVRVVRSHVQVATETVQKRALSVGWKPTRERKEGGAAKKSTRKKAAKAEDSQ